MSTLQLEETRIRAGVWHGVILGSDTEPKIDVRHLDKAVENVTLEQGELGWAVQIPIPVESIADGVQTFAIFDNSDGARIGEFTLIAGEALGDDIRAEVELLRAELDMLKRAFRRHCVETT
ncbi:MAG: hypothetical protein AAF754_15860 [Pseudomonadota bacterium]